jgi:glucose/mannose-6-phosphate isomerase
VIDLDDRSAIAAADPSGMLAAVMAVGEQARHGYRVGRGVEDLPSGDGVRAVVMCGMGGSGVSGDVVRAAFRDRLSVPVAVVRGPALPEFCGKDTLVVASSYSGDTAETLECFEAAADRGCRLVVVTSGGELARRADEGGVPVVRVPGDAPAPRAAIGYLVFGTLGALEGAGSIPRMDQETEHVGSSLDALAEEIAPDRPTETNRSKQVATDIGDRIPVIWGAEGVGEVAALRWKTELNENAKVPAFASSLPELDHNEVVGWSPGAGDRFFLVALRHGMEHPSVAARFPPSLDVAHSAGVRDREVWSDGDSPLSILMSLALLGGATSIYLGILRGVDPAPIDAIRRIKEALGERDAP